MADLWADCVIVLVSDADDLALTNSLDIGTSWINIESRLSDEFYADKTFTPLRFVYD